jgi:DNA-binding XRE family transcriptional regulator
MRPRPNPRTSFAARLIRARGKLTHEEAAAKIGISRRTYENWEQGRYVPVRLTQEAALERL